MRKLFDVQNFSSGQSEFFSQYILFKLRIFLSILLKIFGSSNIFEEIPISKGLQRIFKIPKNLLLRLWSIFQIWRFFVFVFGPFSIFVATLSPSSWSQTAAGIHYWNMDVYKQWFTMDYLPVPPSSMSTLFKKENGKFRT